MDIKNWIRYFKVDPVDLTRCTTNALYTPYVNKELTVFCMSWDVTDQYQSPDTRLNYTYELVDFFFKREVDYLSKVQGKHYSPEVIDIDYAKKQIFFKWYKFTCNDILYDPILKNNMSLYNMSPTWKLQLQNIVLDLVKSDIYKMSLYPHCMYFDDNGILRTFDFYASVNVSNPILDRSVVEAIIGQQSVFRFDEATEGTKINFEVFFKNTLSYIKWPDNALAELKL